MATAEEIIMLLKGMADSLEDGTKEWSGKLNAVDLDNADKPTTTMYHFYSGWVEGQQEAIKFIRHLVNEVS